MKSGIFSGRKIFFINESEARGSYFKIFENRFYLQNGISIKPGDCIFDAGANIGMSTLFFHFESPGSKILAFEPIPEIFNVLKANMDLYSFDTTLCDVGLSSEAGSKTLTYYPGLTLMSSVSADVEEDKNYLASGIKGNAEQTNSILSQFELDKNISIECRMKTLSEVIYENRVEKIDLLKVDVQKSELQVLAGINDSDWNKIQQTVIEVWNYNDELTKICTLLKSHNFNVIPTQIEKYKGTSLHTIYASR
jgi:FkbM family methyltransferase